MHDTILYRLKKALKRDSLHSYAEIHALMLEPGGQAYHSHLYFIISTTIIVKADAFETMTLVYCLQVDP